MIRPLGVGSLPPGVARVSILVDRRWEAEAGLGRVRGVLDCLLEAEEGPTAGVREEPGVTLALFLGDWRTVSDVCKTPWIC